MVRTPGPVAAPARRAGPCRRSHHRLAQHHCGNRKRGPLRALRPGQPCQDDPGTPCQIGSLAGYRATRRRRQTVLRARAALQEVLEASPSLRPGLQAVVQREMQRIRPLLADALAEYQNAPRVKLAQLCYTTDQVLGPWLPENPA